MAKSARYNNHSVSRESIEELGNPDLVYMLGGGGHKPVYIHSHDKTWAAGSHSGRTKMLHILHDLVKEQKQVMRNRAAIIEQKWEDIYQEINKQESLLGNHISISTWAQFVDYFNNLQAQTGVSSKELDSMLNYKIAQSAQAQLSRQRWETDRQYIERLYRIGVIDEKMRKALLDGEVKISQCKFPELTSALEDYAESQRGQFVNNDSVAAWARSFKSDSKTRESYESNPSKFKPNAKQLGSIVEHSLTNRSKQIPPEFSEHIVDGFLGNVFTTMEQSVGTTHSGIIGATLIAGERYGDKGGLNRRINKADLVSSIDFGTVTINFPVSVKTSMQITGIKSADGARIIEAQHLFTATAEAEHVGEYEEINKSVGSLSYERNKDSIAAFAHYVYTNAAALEPSQAIRYYSLFNNQMIYYLAWLKLAIELVGNPTNQEGALLPDQLVMAIQNFNQLYNVADVLIQMSKIQPAQIQDYIVVTKNPLNTIRRSSGANTENLQESMDNVIAGMWKEHLHEGGQKPTFATIYNEVDDVLEQYSHITTIPMPPISLYYKIKLGNAKALTI